MGASFSTFIRNRRAELHLSRAELARRAGLPESRVAYIERVPTASSMRPTTMQALARALDLPLPELLAAAGYADERGAA